MEKREQSLDYIRIIATALILLFHFFAVFQVNSSWSQVFANGTWGYLGTSIFFIMSGYLLRSRHGEIPSVGTFYKKRWLSLFPPFYIAFIVAYLIYAIANKSIFFYGSPFSLIFSLLGIDCYVFTRFGITSYAIVGEWFTGVIIFLYLVFPLMNYLFKRTRIVFSLIILAVYVYMNSFQTAIFPDTSLTDALFLFWMGMFVSECSGLLRKKKLYGVLPGVVCLLLLFLKINVNYVYCTHLLAICLVTALIILIPSEAPKNGLSKAVASLSGVSYCVYLVHHFILNNMKWRLEDWGIVLPIPVLLVLYLVITMMGAFVLKFVTDFLVTKLSKKEKTGGSDEKN